MSGQALDENILAAVSGGNITFTPSSNGSKKGILGWNGREHYSYEDEDKVIDFIAEHRNDKKFKTSDKQDDYLIRQLLKAGLIK